jgi:hypothetical protein
MFNIAVQDDLITFNPFDRIGQNKSVTKDWHHVKAEKFAKLMAAAKPAWRLLFDLARWGGLRLEEALELPKRKADLQKRRLTVISRNDRSEEGGFTVKDKDSHVVPIGPELYSLLRDAFDSDAELVIPPGGVTYQNVWRDFQVIAKRAGVTPYSQPMHSLRKSCITEWAVRFAGVTKNVTKIGDSGSPNRHKSKAGDRIRTGDVQLGKLGLNLAEKCRTHLLCDSLRTSIAVCKLVRTCARTRKESELSALSSRECRRMQKKDSWGRLWPSVQCGMLTRPPIPRNACSPSPSSATTNPRTPP